MMPSVTAERPNGRKPLDVLHLAIALRRYATHRTASASPVGGVRYVVRSGNGDPACWRPAWGGGVRLRGVVWLHRSPFHPVCRFAQDDTVGRRGVRRKTKCRIS